MAEIKEDIVHFLTLVLALRNELAHHVKGNHFIIIMFIEQRGEANYKYVQIWCLVVHKYLGTHVH